MFEISKKGTPERAPEAAPQRQEAGRTEPTTPARPTGHRDAAVIGPSIHIDGDVRGEEDLLIEGEVNGTVQLKNNSLTIGPQGKVRADVYAQTVTVDGYMEGDLFGSERVSIRKSAQVRGNVTSPRVSLEDGAKFKGSIEMDPQAVQSAVGSNRSTGKPQPAPSAPQAKPAQSAQKFDGKPEAAVVKTGAAS